ncbi:hypothetical protein HMPREF1981_00056 [Bacteroides pyogenes F0041]|uniref:Uncharacterized protein n=1 Tax=Bacteroides pyogenes F0041 TaxID=1321819 RepID=U2E988_9BACE|nr:hypothetical protein HMPREF1981_00056 [Bacteroides pyogenes F0041]
MDFPKRYGPEIPVLDIAAANHRQSRCLYSTQGVSASTGDGEGAAGIDTDKPVGFTASLAREIKAVVLPAVSRTGQSLTDSLIGEGADPQAVERFAAIQISIDQAEDQLAFASGVGGDDDAIAPVETLADDTELLQGGRVIRIGRSFADLSDD